MTQMPLVLPNDDGIRPAGAPDECFYCRQKIGQPHGRECVAVHKKVKVLYTYELEIEVPYFWTKENVESHRNESSWCASNGIEELNNHFGREDTDCGCAGFSCEYIEDVPGEPYGKECPVKRQPRESAVASGDKFRQN